MSKVRVYVAGPLNADSAVGYIQNLRDMINAGYTLMIAGYAPYVPGLDFMLGFQDEYNQLDYDAYYTTNEAWLEIADCMLKIGDSPGADNEEQFCWKHNIPVYYSISELLACAPTP